MCVCIYIYIYIYMIMIMMIARGRNRATTWSWPSTRTLQILLLLLLLLRLLLTIIILNTNTLITVQLILHNASTATATTTTTTTTTATTTLLLLLLLTHFIINNTIDNNSDVNYMNMRIWGFYSVCVMTFHSDICVCSTVQYDFMCNILDREGRNTSDVGVDDWWFCWFINGGVINRGKGLILVWHGEMIKHIVYAI